MPSVLELRAICRSSGISGYSKLRKDELLALLVKAGIDCTTATAPTTPATGESFILKSYNSQVAVDWIKVVQRELSPSHLVGEHAIRLEGGNKALLVFVTMSSSTKAGSYSTPVIGSSCLADNYTTEKGPIFFVSGYADNTGCGFVIELPAAFKVKRRTWHIETKCRAETPFIFSVAELLMNLRTSCGLVSEKLTELEQIHAENKRLRQQLIDVGVH